MARLRIEIEVDVDPTLTDPGEVAGDLLADEDIDNISLRQYSGCFTEMMSAEWVS